MTLKSLQTFCLLMMAFSIGGIIGVFWERAITPDCLPPIQPPALHQPTKQISKPVFTYPVEPPVCWTQGLRIICRDPNCTWDGSAVKCLYSGSGWTVKTRRY